MTRKLAGEMAALPKMPIFSDLEPVPSGWGRFHPVLGIA